MVCPVRCESSTMWLLPPTRILWYALYDAKVRRRGLATHDNTMARPVRCDSSTLEDRACQPLRIGSLGGLTTYMIDGMAVGAVVLLWRAEQQRTTTNYNHYLRTHWSQDLSPKLRTT